MRLFLIAFLLINNSVFAQDTLLNHIRRNVGEMFQTENVCTNIYEALKNTDYEGNNMLLGYHGAASIGMARHVANPFKKMSYLNDGKELLDRSIEQDNQNVELRFLRLTIQANLPGFLGYNANKESDKGFVMNNLEGTNDEAFRNRVRTFVKKAEEEGKL